MDKILVLDFGGQYNELIARRVRSLNVYAEIISYDRITIEEIKDKYKGIIFTGGPNSVNDNTSPHYEDAILDVGEEKWNEKHKWYNINYLCHEKGLHNNITLKMKQKN